MKLLTILLFTITLLFAEHDRDEYKEHHLPLDMSYLELSDHQYKSLKKIIKKFKHEYREFHEQEREIRKKISKLFLSEKFNRDEFIELTNQIKSRSVEIQADFFLKMHELLTPTQKKDFVKYMQEWEVE
jgi:Spy/CpxP family protein refolding chaperone